MKQTAVQWLFLMLNNPNRDQEFANKLLEKALEMEKEQMKLAYHEDRPFLLGYETGEFFEEHYQENYETKND